MSSPDLDVRYGRAPRSGGPGRGAVVGGVLVCLAVLVAVVVVGRAWTDTPVQSGLVSYTDTTEDSITVTIDVRREPGTPVTCVVELTTITRLDTRQELEIPAGPEPELQVTHVFRTAQPVAARLLGCRGPGQDRLA